MTFPLRKATPFEMFLQDAQMLADPYASGSWASAYDGAKLSWEKNNEEGGRFIPAWDLLGFFQGATRCVKGMNGHIANGPDSASMACDWARRFKAIIEDHPIGKQDQETFEKVQSVFRQMNFLYATAAEGQIKEIARPAEAEEDVATVMVPFPEEPGASSEWERVVVGNEAQVQENATEGAKDSFDPFGDDQSGFPVDPRKENPFPNLARKKRVVWSQESTNCWEVNGINVKDVLKMSKQMN